MSFSKSPVPDTASPVHGYSRSMAYARAVYLMLLVILIYVLLYINSSITQPILFYGFEGMIFVMQN